MDPITVQIIDPQSSGISKEVLLAGAGILGTLLASFLGSGDM
jgi:hypothetical protein